MVKAMVMAMVMVMVTVRLWSWLGLGFGFGLGSGVVLGLVLGLAPGLGCMCYHHIRQCTAQGSCLHYPGVGQVNHVRWSRTHPELTHSDRLNC